MNTSVEVELYTQRAAQSCELTKEKKKKKMTAGFFKLHFPLITANGKCYDAVSPMIYPRHADR